jgi:arginine deiminase
MGRLDVETLVAIVFSRPRVFLKKDTDGTSLDVAKIEIAPLSNMIFIRDQQIVTAKGLVIGNMMTTVRKFEKEVLKKCFEILKIRPVGIAPEGICLITQVATSKAATSLP